MKPLNSILMITLSGVIRSAHQWNCIYTFPALIEKNVFATDHVNTAPRNDKSYCLFGRKSHLSDKLVWVTTTVDLYHRTGNVRCVIHMSHDTPCHSVVWVSRRRRDDTGTPKNKNIHICMWSKVDGVLIGDIPAYFYSILVHFVHLETAGVWQWRYSGVIT